MDADEKLYLVVDDDDNFRKKLTEALILRGHFALSAANVSAALEICSAHKITHVVLDLKMPEVDGLSGLSMLLDHDANLQIVILTGYGSIATTQAAIKRGAISYLTKPCSVQEVICAFDYEPQAQVEIPSIDQVEWDHIQRILFEYQGNITHAAKALRIDRRSLQRKLQKIPQNLK
ncbi:response regulator [bacterium]|nr:response regulator [bacterium]